MKYIFKRILCTYFYIKGKKYLENQNPYNALDFFLKAKKYCGDDLYLYIYMALAEFLIKYFDNSLIHFQKSLFLLNKNKKLNSDEKSYIKKYIVSNIIDLEKIFNNKRALEEYKNIYNGIIYNKDNINKNLFYDFPLENSV